jgi:hypothetical protein
MLPLQLLNVRSTTAQHRNMKFSFKYHTSEEWRVSELDQPWVTGDADDVARKLSTKFFIDYTFYCNVNKQICQITRKVRLHAFFINKFTDNNQQYKKYC